MNDQVAGGTPAATIRPRFFLKAPLSICDGTKN